MTTKTFEERFLAAQTKNYSQGIAKKMYRDIDDFKGLVSQSPNTVRRWVWELIQNASDASADTGVDIEIAQGEKEGVQYISFKHNGLPFTAENIQNLIEQTSGKDSKKPANGRRKQTGKFGTGFLTTQLLSDIVDIQGVNQDEDGPYYRFDLRLDRSGDEDDIARSLTKAGLSVKYLDKNTPYDDYDATRMNTRFIFPLKTQRSLEVAEKGIADLKTNLPYSLCFVDSINSVTIKQEGLIYKRIKNSHSDVADAVQTVEITVLRNSQEVGHHYFKVFTNDLTSIVIPYEESISKLSITNIPSTVPKLFCDFPLIGTESFPFPVIINNPNFNPTNPRDGLNLANDADHAKSVENWKYIREAVDLFKKLTNHAITNKWENLHELTRLGTLKNQIAERTSKELFDRDVSNVLKKLLETSDVVKDSLGNFSSMLNSEGKQRMWFTAASTKEARLKLYDLCLYLIPEQLPDSSLIEFWYHTYWNEKNKLTFYNIAATIEENKTIEKLSAFVKGIDSITWINQVFEMFKLDEEQFSSLMDKHAIVPNQAGTFSKKGQLYKQVGKIESTFLDILKLFGNDVRETLADNNIKLDFDNRVYTQGNVVAALISEVELKTQSRESMRKYQPALNLLLQYINGNQADAHNLIPTIVKDKHMLYDEDVLVENIKKAEKLSDLLIRFQVPSAEALRQKFERLEASGKSLLPITEEIIASLGITSLEEWEKAMENVDLKSLFDHQSVATYEMLVHAIQHINRARERVINHLGTLSDYDLRDLDKDAAKTVLLGIRKKGEPVDIVFRPAYKNEVIIYYESERDTLDFGNAELWVDDGKEVREITLGYIIKKNAIKKFPI